jgi:hypothetical protein
MRISIAERLRPFCHVPGTSTILPGCGYQVQIYPCLIRIYHLQKTLPILIKELSLDLKGPIQQFTICNDLEKGQITVSGKTEEGWMRYHLISALRQEGVRLLIDKAPPHGFPIDTGKGFQVLHNKEWLDLLETDLPFEPYTPPPCDRLSLGNHKAQDWELIKRRFDFKEIFPLIHRLGQLIPSMANVSFSREGTLALLEECRQSLTIEKGNKGEEKWQHFLLGCFNHLLVPQFEDINYQGLIKSEPLVSLDISPLLLLAEGSRLIRQLFVRQEADRLFILPHLLPSLHCGRLVDYPLDRGGWLSIEWTKKSIRQMILYAEQDQELTFQFRPDVHSYRLRHHEKEKGERKSSQSSLFLEKNCYYLFDNFQ